MNSIIQRFPALLKRKPVKILLIIFTILVSSSIALYFALPPLLTAKIPQLIHQQTGRKSSLAAVQLSLSPLQLQLQQFKLLETNNNPFISFENFSVQINFWESLKQKTLLLDSVILSKPFVHIVKQKDGSFNFSHLIKTNKEPKKPTNEDTTLFPVKITKIELKTGELIYADNHTKQSIKPIDLSISNFSTMADSQFDLGFTLVLDALGELNWQGTMSINPLASKGRIQLNKIALENINALINNETHHTNNPSLQGEGQLTLDYNVKYAHNKLTVQADSLQVALQGLNYNNQLKLAKFNYETDLKLNYDNQTWQFEATKASIHSDNAMVQLSPAALLKIDDLKLTSIYSGSYAQDKLQFVLKQTKLDSKDIQLFETKQDKPLIKIPEFLVRGVALDLENKQLSIDSVSLNNANVQAWLNNDGVVNYQTLFATNKANDAPPAETTNNSQTWAIQLNNLALKEASVLFVDKTPAKPVSFNLKAVNLSLKDFNTKEGAVMPVQFAMAINGNSLLSLEGTSTLKPISTQLTVALKELSLKNLQPYVDKVAKLELVDGKFSVNGQLFIAQSETGTAIKFNGNSSIAQFLTRDTILHKDLIKWEDLSLADINIDMQEQRYTASALVLKKPYAKVTISENKILNFSEIAINTPEKNSVADKSIKEAKETTKKPFFNLGKIQLIDGSSDFTDLSLILPFYAQIRSLEGGASGLSSEQKSTIKAQLKGTAYDLAPVSITADMNPQLGDYAINLDFDGMPMPLMSPYMVQFAGYKVENGKLSLDLNYQIAEKKLTATNKIVIDQFELGDKVENPKAVSLPLDLAVALLKDASGRIKLNVPITGSLDDPHFNIAAVVSDALMNAISKLVTSPFRLLASLVDSDADMSSVAFSAGNAQLDNAQLLKLDTLAKALKERPQLHLTIKGVSFQAQDWPIIQHDALYDQLKMIRAAEIKQQEKRDILPEYVQISDEDYRRLLTQLFTEKLPLLAEQVLALKDSSDIKSVQKYYATAEQKLAEILSPEQQRLKNLAASRAQSIANYLVKQGGVDNARVFILDTQIQPSSNGELLSILALK